MFIAVFTTARHLSHSQCVALLFLNTSALPPPTITTPLQIKASVPLCVTVKNYGWMEVQIHVFVTLKLRNTWPASCPDEFTSQNWTRYPLGRTSREFLSPPGRFGKDTNIPVPVPVLWSSTHSAVTILTELQHYKGSMCFNDQNKPQIVLWFITVSQPSQNDAVLKRIDPKMLSSEAA